MSVFVWTYPPANDGALWSQDQISTSNARGAPLCLFCGERFEAGQKAWAWNAIGGDIVAHAACVKRTAPGLLLDIAECLR